MRNKQREVKLRDCKDIAQSNAGILPQGVGLCIHVSIDDHSSSGLLLLQRADNTVTQHAQWTHLCIPPLNTVGDRLTIPLASSKADRSKPSTTPTRSLIL